MSGEKETGLEGKKGIINRVKERERSESLGNFDDLWKKKERN